jgi:thiol-disulfide isomerase/thioredoxin
MSGVTAGALVLLGALTVLNLALTLAVIRRLRTLDPGSDRKVEPSEVLPAAGDIVGALPQADLSTGRHTVVLITPSCPPCQDMLADLTSDVDGYAAGTLVCVVTSADDWQPVAARLTGYRTIHLEERAAEAVFRVRGFPAVLSIEDGVVTRSGHELPARV